MSYSDGQTSSNQLRDGPSTNDSHARTPPADVRSFYLRTCCRILSRRTVVPKTKVFETAQSALPRLRAEVLISCPETRLKIKVSEVP